MTAQRVNVNYCIHQSNARFKAINSDRDSCTAPPLCPPLSPPRTFSNTARQQPHPHPSQTSLSSATDLLSDVDGVVRSAVVQTDRREPAGVKVHSLTQVPHQHHWSPIVKTKLLQLFLIVPLRDIHLDTWCTQTHHQTTRIPLRPRSLTKTISEPFRPLEPDHSVVLQTTC